MRRALAATAVVALMLTGCSGGDEPTADDSPSPSPTESPNESPSESPAASSSANEDDEIEIEINGDRIQPNGKRMQVAVGETIRLEIESDRAGELHVHSSPDQEVPFPKGDSSARLSVDTPGLVDVEEHESGIVVLQLEAR